MADAMRSLRILYAALDQTVPGTLGGSVHVQAVAEGLAALGHDVHVAVQSGDAWPAGRVHWRAMSPPMGRPELRWLRRRRVAALAREIRADVIMERYYNFGGEGVLAADDLGIPAVLEVNAPVIDFPGSAKGLLDRALVVEPMRRWRDRLCRLTTLFVTPSADILPAWVDRRADPRDRMGRRRRSFPSGCAGRSAVRAGRRPDPVRVRGRVPLVARRGRICRRRSRACLRRATRASAGSSSATARNARPPQRGARGVPGVQFTGFVPHARLPAALAARTIGVAPFDPAQHAPLQLGFYWSPLKIFEYMAVGLPVVAPALARLSRLVQHGREGMLYDPGDPRGLDRAIVTLADPAVRQRMGAAARARVVRDFSWQAHCRALDARLQEVVGR